MIGLFFSGVGDELYLSTAGAGQPFSNFDGSDVADRLRRVLAAMTADPSIEVATPALRVTPEIHRRLLADQREGRVGGTTAAIQTNGDALYFSKSVIPHVAASAVGDPTLPVFLHIGVYAYTRAALQAYATLPPTPLELLEGLEQLRFIEHGRSVRVVEVAAPGYDIWELNNPEDVGPIEAAFRARGLD